MDYKDFQKGVDAHHFWFRAKREHMAFLMRSAGLKFDAKVLCVGVGTGEDLIVLRSFGNLYAIDIDQQALALVPDHVIVEKKYADVCDLPYPNDFFDCVIACDVLEHIEHDDTAIVEIRRVLKPGGSFVFTVPANMFLFGAHDRALGHHRRYNKPMLRKLLNSLQIKTLGYWFFSGFFPLAIMRFFKKKSSESGMFALPSVLNTLVYGIMHCENKLIQWGFKFPWGLSLYGICTKRD